MVTAFVEGWDLVQTLGEGAYGEVKLAVNQENQQAVAVKIIDLKKSPQVEKNIKKEVIIHRMLKHENIITFYGTRKDGDRQYIFLEYACGGELFDRIEPDIGMSQAQAQKYFRDLICGVEYLHSQGVSHRDLKPENLLLDDFDNLKITDFGLATMFRYQGKNRKLETCCGTVPYVAPEVISKKPYDGEAVDVWSCGIILVALLAGELPWDEPTYSCQEYIDWKDCKITLSPWNKIEYLALSLFRAILNENPNQRCNLQVIKNHMWYKKNFTEGKDLRKVSSSSISESPQGGSALKKQCTGLSPSSRDDSGKISMSQPEPGRQQIGANSQPSIAANDPYGMSFSQPAQADDMLLNSQILGTQALSQTPMQRLVRRMTRFFVRTDLEETQHKLIECFEKLGYNAKNNAPGQFTVLTMDKRRMSLTFKAFFIDMGENILIDFRLSKGDGLEFKKHFVKIRTELSSIVIKRVPATPLMISSQVNVG